MTTVLDASFIHSHSARSSQVFGVKVLEKGIQEGTYSRPMGNFVRAEAVGLGALG